MKITVKTDVDQLVAGMVAAGFSPYLNDYGKSLQIWADMFFKQDVLVRVWGPDYITLEPCRRIGD